MAKSTLNETERMVVTRVFDAPRELVWKAWTDPQYVKQIFIKSTFFKLVLKIAMLFVTAFKSNGQQIKPAESGYSPVNGIEVYYEVSSV